MLEFLKALDVTQWGMIGLLVFLVLTGKVVPATLLQPLLQILRRALTDPNNPAPPVPLPGPGPATPGPIVTTVIQHLLDLLTRVQAAGDKEGEKAIMATMKYCCDCNDQLPHTH